MPAYTDRVCGELLIFPRISNSPHTGFNVLMEHDFEGKRQRLRRGSITGRSILWYEHNNRRTDLLRWPGEDAITLIKQDSDDEVAVAVASNDVEVARRIIAEIEKLLPCERVNGETVLPITFWHRGSEAAEITLLKSKSRAGAKSRQTTSETQRTGCLGWQIDSDPTKALGGSCCGMANREQERPSRFERSPGHGKNGAALNT